MKIKRIVFSDVDGTICSFPDKKENPETRKSILEAIENDNITFVLNTGNPPLPKILKMANELNAKYLVALLMALLSLMLKKMNIYTNLN